MKRMILAVALLLATFASANAVGFNFAEIRYVHKDSAAKMFGGAWVQQDSVAGILGAWGWAQSDPHYTEAYAGPWVAPTRWSQIGVAYGQENATHPARYAGFVWFGSKRLSSFTIVEDGGTGAFLLNRSAYKTGKFHVGTWTDNGAGICPEVRFSPTKVITVWGARTLLGFRNTTSTTRLAMDYAF